VYPHRQCWRAVFSEADGLPGLIVDRFGEIAVIQVLTAAMELRRDFVIRAVVETLGCKGIFERSDSAQRSLEGLEPRLGPVWGEVPESLLVEDPEGIVIEASMTTGQKTGLFLDHHDNRLLLDGRAMGARVLDAFCYVGQWACCAIRWGAESVLGIDSSGEAIAQAEANAQRNGVGERCRFVKGDVFDELRRLEKERESFNVIVLDPPAFAKSRRQMRDALRGYREINLRAMRCLAKGGYLFTASCSHHVNEVDFREMLVRAATNAGREFIFDAPLRQSADHPILLGHPETAYLKGAVLRRTK
jgi:23S rRNA (cytosine1962-C5)-methyltransferase